jgi:hypothetical protein
MRRGLEALELEVDIEAVHDAEKMVHVATAKVDVYRLNTVSR